MAVEVDRRLAVDAGVGACAGNLPHWATEFAPRTQVRGRQAKVVNGLGEFYFSVSADAASGVIDMYAGPAEDDLALFPTRVVPLGQDTSAHSFTMFKAPGMPDELFESQYESLRREFDNVTKRREGSSR